MTKNETIIEECNAIINICEGMVMLNGIVFDIKQEIDIRYNDIYNIEIRYGLSGELTDRIIKGEDIVKIPFLKCNIEYGINQFKELYKDYLKSIKVDD